MKLDNQGVISERCVVVVPRTWRKGGEQGKKMRRRAHSSSSTPKAYTSTHPIPLPPSPNPPLRTCSILLYEALDARSSSPSPPSPSESSLSKENADPGGRRRAAAEAGGGRPRMPGSGFFCGTVSPYFLGPWSWPYMAVVMLWSVCEGGDDVNEICIGGIWWLGENLPCLLEVVTLSLSLASFSSSCCL